MENTWVIITKAKTYIFFNLDILLPEIYPKKIDKDEGQNAKMFFET